MCGILYVKRLDNKPAAKILSRRYRKQRGRGSEGFGFISIKQSGRATAPQRFMYEHEALSALKDNRHQHVLMHHRFPTSTPNVPESTHPLLIAHAELQYDYFVLHNGTISNDVELKTAHEKLGYKYHTELYTKYTATSGKTYHDPVMWNDSEALAIELARTIEGKQNSVLARGNIAYIVLQVEKTTHQALALYYGTNGGNPLTIQRTKEFLCIASEGGTAVNDDICYRLNLKTLETVEIPSVKMQTVTVAHKTRYSYTTPYPYSDHEYSGYSGYWPDPIKGKKDEGQALQNVEEELQDMEEEIIGASADIELAIEQGDTELERECKEDLKDFTGRKNALMREYERLALAA